MRASLKVVVLGLVVLLVDHQEYRDRIRLYEEINIDKGTPAQMHGAAVASIAVGKTVGVAPEADLYYIAKFNTDFKEGRGGGIGEISCPFARESGER